MRSSCEDVRNEFQVHNDHNASLLVIPIIVAEAGLVQVWDVRVHRIFRRARNTRHVNSMGVKISEPRLQCSKNQDVNRRSFGVVR